MNKDSMAKYIDRAAVIKNLQEKKIIQSEAAMQLGLSIRQIRRIAKKYKEGGVEALFHKNKAKPSPRKISSETERQAIAWIVNNGQDFGPTFSQEKLSERLNIHVSVGTVRNWLIKNGIRKPRKKSHQKEFMHRDRKKFFGVMLQVDGSPHDWFEGRGERCFLLTVIDDATGLIMTRFAKGETSRDLMILFKKYIETYGRPLSVYSDNGGAYKVNTGNAEGEKKTQLGRALDELGIELIFARSPQAKGRVERNHATNQDRLIKEMRLRNISTIETANRYLEEEYIAQFNEKFAIKPASPHDVHRSPKGFNLDHIFSLQEERVMQNDGIVQFNKNLFQITKNRTHVKPKTAVMIREHLDGRLTIWKGDLQLGYERIMSKPTAKPVERTKEYTPRKKIHPNSRLWNSGFFAAR